MSDGKVCSLGNAVCWALLMLYGCTVVNIPVGLAMATVCRLRKWRSADADERRRFGDMTHCWLVSCVPLCGPPLAIWTYSLAGLGT